MTNREQGRELARTSSRLLEMVQQGKIVLPEKPRKSGVYPLLTAVTPPGTAQRLLDEERGER